MFQIASFKIICTYSTEILFSKLRSAGLNYHLSKQSFSLFLTVRGVSNKHCLLTFFDFSTCIGYTGQKPNLLSDSLTQLGHAIPHLFNIMFILISLLLCIMYLDNWSAYMGFDGRETYVFSVNTVLI